MHLKPGANEVAVDSLNYITNLKARLLCSSGRLATHVGGCDDCVVRGIYQTFFYRGPLIHCVAASARDWWVRLYR